MRNRNEALLTTLPMNSGHRSKLKVVQALVISLQIKRYTVPLVPTDNACG